MNPGDPPIDQLRDEEIVARLVQAPRDQAAIEELVHRFGDRMRSLVRLLVPDSFVEDVLQEAYVWLFGPRGLADHYRADVGPVWPLVASVVRSRCHDLLRRRNVIERVLRLEDVGAQPLDPARPLDEVEIRDLVQAAEKRLPDERDRRILHLLLEGKSVGDLALEMNLSQATAYRLVNRVRELLAPLFDVRL